MVRDSEGCSIEPQINNQNTFSLQDCATIVITGLVSSNHINANDFILNKSHKFVSSTRSSDTKYGEPDKHGHCRDNTNIPSPGTDGVNIIDTLCITDV